MTGRELGGREGAEEGTDLVGEGGGCLGGGGDGGGHGVAARGWGEASNSLRGPGAVRSRRRGRGIGGGAARVFGECRVRVAAVGPPGERQGGGDRAHEGEAAVAA